MKLKKFTLRFIAGANVATIVLMWLIGMSDRINPVAHPVIACMGLAFPILILVNIAFLVFFLLFKWRYAVVPFLGFVVCYFPIRLYCPINVSKSIPDGSLKVLSYNVCAFDSVRSDENGGNPILDYIVKSNADIVCLQEARYNAGIDAAVKATYAYRDTVYNRGGSAVLLLLSKFPILSKRRIEYESVGNVSAAFEVKIGRDTVNVISNHFETSGLSIADRKGFKNIVKGEVEADEMRKESHTLLSKLSVSARKRAPQADAVAKYVSGCRNAVILCGDFNDNPISYTHRTVGKGLADCFVESGFGSGFSYHHNAIRVRIDNIMCSDSFMPYGCKVDDSIEYSDHYPIYCWLDKE